jgi:hypothetical protein
MTNPLPIAFTTTIVSAADSQTLPADGTTSVSVNWAAGGGALKLYMEAGKTYWLARTSTTGTNDTIYFRRWNQQGELAGSSYIYSNGGGWAITPETTGEYTVQLTGIYNGLPMSGSSTFVLYPGQTQVQPFTLGSVIDASLNQPAEKARYQFTLAESTWVWIDAIGDNYTGSLVRTDQPSTIFSNGGMSGYGERRLMLLAAGSYEMQLTPNQIAPGAYHLSISKASDLPELKAGSSASISVAQGRYTTAYRIDGARRARSSF